jgi:hypothetical protein
MPLLKVNQIASYTGNTLTIGTTGDTVTLAAGSTSSGFGATYNSGLNWTSTLVTSALTVSAGVGYFVNTSTAAITVTLPASPTFGSIVGIADYSGYAATNRITVNPNGNKLEGATLNKLIITNKESIILNYVDSTRGWLPTSGVNNGTDALTPISYSVDFLVIAGGGGGGGAGARGAGGAGGYRNSYASEQSGGGGSSEASLTFNPGIVYTITVGSGGANGGATDTAGFNGNDSSISGSDITTITSTGGGRGGGDGSAPAFNGGNGGSGGGSNFGGPAGNGTANQGYNGGVGSTGASVYGGGGGGGASAAGTNGNSTNGGNGGNGLASSITGSSVTRGGGGAGGTYNGSGAGTAGSGGGGVVGTAGTANTGGGGGGCSNVGVQGGAGGKGVVILRIPTANYTGTTTGSPTVTTDGSDKVIVFNDSGSYTG